MASSLRYPLQRIDEYSDYLKITVVTYKPPGLGSGNQGFFALPTGTTSNQGNDQTIQGHIFLPIPLGLRDRNSVDWTGKKLNGLAAAGIRELGGIVDSLNLDNLQNDTIGTLRTALKKTSGSLTRALDTIKGDKKTQDVLKGALIAQAVNVFGANVSLSDITSRTEGVVLNPNLELLFQGVDLRTFSFSFEFTPRSARESQEVKAIINTFKRRMAAKTSVDGSFGSKGLFIGAPDVFNLEFRKGGDKHPFLFKMKTCALKNIEVSYSDTGAYTTYEDGTPVKMTMILTFTELNPIYQEDYSDNLDEGVGF